MFRKKVSFYGAELTSPRPTPKLEDHPLSVVRNCLFNIFAATLHTGGRSSFRNLRTRHAVVTGTHLLRITRFTVQKFYVLPTEGNYVFCIEQTAIISPHSNNLSVFTTLTESVQRYCSNVELSSRPQTN
jgi:hypothetical protein